MKTKLPYYLSVTLVSLAEVSPGLAQTTNLGIARLGKQVVLVWPAKATNYVLQSTTNLLPAAWSTVANVPVVVNGQYTETNATSGTQQFYLLSQFTIPPGMALIPAGSFTMGDSLDGENDATPTNVTVSAFFMDTNLVSLSQWQAVRSLFCISS